MQLDGVTVLDLTRLLPGNFTTQLLCDLGADVIKIEDPTEGDYGRYLSPQTDEGVSALFTAANRGKRSVTLDLKRSADRDAFYTLAETADVVVETFRPGVTDRLGVDYDTLTEYNADLIYCSLSGYGQTGPSKDCPGHDVNYAGITGLVDMNRPTEDVTPALPGAQMADLSGGVFAAFIIAGHLAGHARTGDGGDYIDVSMTDVGYTISMIAPLTAMTGSDPRPGQTELNGSRPCYGIYETADERYVTLAALEPKFWRAFCDVVERPDLVAAHLSDDQATKDALTAELEALFAERTRAEWADRFDGTDVPFGVVNTPAETLSDPHLSARDMASTGPPGRSIPHVRFPAKRRHDARPDHVEYPDHGEHTEAVLREAGYTDDDLASLDGYDDA